MPNCISRGGFALKIRPKFGLPNVRFGRSKLARFSRLKTSHRNSMSRPSPIDHVLATEKSTLT